MIPKSSAKIPLLLTEFHRSLRGHSGFFKSFKRVAAVVYLEGTRKGIQDYVNACEVCQRNKYETLSTEGLLQPLSVFTQFWAEISLDFIGGLPRTKGKDTIFVVADPNMPIFSPWDIPFLHLT